MTQPINRLNNVDAVTAGDLLVAFFTNSGQARNFAVSVLQTYMQENLDFTQNEFKTEYFAPSATAFTYIFTETSQNVHLIMTPTGTLAAGTLQLPALASMTDKTTILVNSTNEITALTIDGSGATVNGAPTTLLANEFFTLKFDKNNSTWYRVG